MLGSAISRAADRHGWATLIPATLSTPIPLAAANFVIALLSLGYDLTQPLLAGIWAETLNNGYVYVYVSAATSRAVTGSPTTVTSFSSPPSRVVATTGPVKAPPTQKITPSPTHPTLAGTQSARMPAPIRRDANGFALGGPQQPVVPVYVVCGLSY